MTVNKNDEKPSEFQKITSSYRSGWVYAEYAFQYGLSIVICSLIGYWLDKVFGTNNILLIAGVILGSVGGFINLLRALNSADRQGKSK
ncbi:MAG: AtpZ/AtpI family protein [Ignavibacteria bacterium]|nr:AtpZ/AtpI family protein [Ignavibacteria bacterium]